VLFAASAPVRGGDSAADAAQPKLDKVVARLQEHYRATRSFTAKFKEEITTVGGAKREREGTVVYLKPGRMRWEFAPPEQETVVSDGKTLYSYQPDLNQVIETPLERAFKSSAPTALLLGIGDIRRDFTASAVTDARADGLVHLALVPKSEGMRIALGLDPKTFDVLKLTVTDELGNITALQFADLKVNSAVDDSLFSFKIPEGADVITAPDRH
jgi:outer membrane lipoprotein carrier protein